LANASVKNAMKKCLNFRIRSSISLREDGRARMDWEVAADSHLFVLSSVIVQVQTRNGSACANVLKGPQGSQGKSQENV
jgi:hypothetical protein